jgi:hypothetical protein
MSGALECRSEVVCPEGHRGGRHRPRWITSRIPRPPSASPCCIDFTIVEYGSCGCQLCSGVGRGRCRGRCSGRLWPGGPRAATFDDETMRTFARLGIAQRLLPTLRVQRNYEWRNASGDLLIEQVFAETGRSGWAGFPWRDQCSIDDLRSARSANRTSTGRSTCLQDCPGRNATNSPVASAQRRSPQCREPRR